MKNKTLKQAGYKYMGYEGDGFHLLRPIETNLYQQWRSVPKPVKGCLKFKKTYLVYDCVAGGLNDISI